MKMGIPANSADDLERDPIPLLDSFDAPPDIYTYLRRRITGKEAAYPLPGDLLQTSRLLGQWQELGEVRPLRLTPLVINVYNALCPDTNLPLQPAVMRASQAVLVMVASGLDEKWVDNLAIAVAIPIREAMKICQGSPPRDWPVDAYRFVGRSDQAIQSLALAGDEFQRNVETVSFGEQMKLIL
jgi:anaphase-promoting complex subunit 1